MSKTINWLAEDIQLRIYGGTVSDDAHTSLKQIKGWLGDAYARAVAQIFMRGGLPSGIIKPYTCVEISKETVDCEDCPVYSVTLPVEVVELPMDAGVVRVYYPNGGATINRMGHGGFSGLFDHLPFSRGADKKGWYREGQKLWLKGQYVEKDDVNLFLIPALSSYSGTDAFPAQGELMGKVLDYAEQIGRRQVGTPQDIINDGRD